MSDLKETHLDEYDKIKTAIEKFQSDILDDLNAFGGSSFKDIVLSAKTIG